jgi:beta-1,4-mannosyltransferase
MVDGIIVLSESSRIQILKHHPKLREIPHVVTRLGHFRDEYPPIPGKKAARHSLGLQPSDFVFLNFGQIRPYKNVPHLLKTFRSCKSSTLRLIVAGKPINTELKDEIIGAAGGDSRILLDLKFVDNEMLVNYLAAADLVVLPFSQILNSASVMLSLSFARRVLVPRTAAFNELRQDVGGNWILTYDKVLKKTDLELAYEAAEVAGLPNLSDYEWPLIGSRTAGFFWKLARSSSRLGHRIE